MRYSSIDSLYAHINKHILLAQGYTEIPELYFIIKSCRLKPYEYVFEGSNKLALCPRWIDEHGNSFLIENKDILIKYNDLSLDKNKIICTDLYCGSSLKKLQKLARRYMLSPDSMKTSKRMRFSLRSWA